MVSVFQGQPGEMGEPGEKVSCGAGVSSWSRTVLPDKWPKSITGDCHMKVNIYWVSPVLHFLPGSSVALC